MSRKVFSILSPRSLPYAKLSFESLLLNILDDIELYILTDSKEDKQTLVDFFATTENPQKIDIKVYSEHDCAELARQQWAEYPNLTRFRQGHPCWRKATDPLLFTQKEDFIVLDPDLLFPNKFNFEPEREAGVYLMWQRPCCLFPEDIVMSAYEKGYQLAHHVDIGVAQVYNDIDLQWLDTFVKELGGDDLPRNIMHIEAIVWAALLMKQGGGYLNKAKWKCYQNSHWKRLALKIGISGQSILKVENFKDIKCFHAGGKPKWWLAEDVCYDYKNSSVKLSEKTQDLPVVEMTKKRFSIEASLKRFLKSFGYYALINSKKSLNG